MPPRFGSATMAVLPVASLLLLLSYPAEALYEDEVGQLDFLLPTAGHGYGGVRFSSRTSSGVVTSSSHPRPFVPDLVAKDSNADGSANADGMTDGGCHVASRDPSTGSLQWRKDVCTTTSTAASIRHVVRVSPTSDTVYTLDDVGLFRGWNATNGAMLFDSALEFEADETPRILGVDSLDGKVVVCSLGIKKGGEAAACHNAVSGVPLLASEEGEDGPIPYLFAENLLSASKIKKSAPTGADKLTAMARFLDMFEDGGSVKVLIGWVFDLPNGQRLVSGGGMAVAELIAEDGKVNTSAAVALKGYSSALLASSLQTHTYGGVAYLLGVDSNGESFISLPLDGSASEDRVDVNQIIALKPLGNALSVRTSSGEKLFAFVGGDTTWEYILPEEEFSAVSYCNHFVVAIQDDGSRVKVVSGYSVEGAPKKLSPSGDVVLGDESVTNLDLLSCHESTMEVMLTTSGGTTTYLTLSKRANSFQSTQSWTAEEALGSITSTIFLDESQSPLVAQDEDEEVLLEQLSFPSRMQAQVESLASLLSGDILNSFTSIFQPSELKSRKRDYAFGFAKIAVLLSNPLNKVMGIDTASKGKILWKISLNSNAAWHKLLYGSASGRSGQHGINDGVHGHEVLALSYVFSTATKGAEMEWKCLDGTTGRIYSSSSIPVLSDVVQIMPVFHPHHHHANGGCKQVALLLHSDDTVSIVPDDAQARTAALELIDNSRNGLYSHAVNKATGTFRSLRVFPTPKGEDGPFGRAELVGETSFSTETILSVTYPSRDEMIQSPTTILGDDSLLLKYLNPHLAVVVTVAKEEDLKEMDKNEGWYKALGETTAGSGVGSGGGGTGKKKPLGVTKPGEEAPAAAEESAAVTKMPVPSLFVNVMDTVSGRILYRASHSHVSPGSSDLSAPPPHVPVLVSENWVFYAYFSAKTRRTELGVLTLHEGMIDKHGITAFATPDQEDMFSSLESSKPIVLAKTYGITKQVTAMGITKTRGGISTKQVLLATGDDKIATVDRRLLDPRRPTGEVKESEKLEGLMRYAPLISLLSLRMPSHTHTVHSVLHIQSTSASVESQSLSLAYGGPDIFFTRIAPSKGFDLLPESFNRGLLAIVMLGLLGLLATVKRMGTKKTVDLGWS